MTAPRQKLRIDEPEPTLVGPATHGGGDDIAHGQPVRIAMMFQESADLPAWAIRLIDIIIADPQLQLCAFIQPGGRKRASSTPALARLWLACEQRIFASLQRPTSHVSEGGHRELPRIAADNTEALAGLCLDVILDFTDRYGSGCDRRLARHGTWFMNFPVNNPNAAGLAEIVRREPLVEIALLRRTADHDQPTTIAQGVINPKFVATRTGWFMVEKAVLLLQRELRNAYRSGGAPTLPLPTVPPRQAPGYLDLFSYLGALFATLSHKAFNALVARAGFRPSMFFLKTAMANLHDFDPAKAASIVPAGNALYADPFLWERDGQCYCFFEDFEYSTNRGHISVGKFVDDRLTDIRPVLRRDYHLSFPFLFEDGGTLYMMPETYNADRLEVWKCTAFPDRWELHATAFDGIRAADSSLTKIDGKWWLFTNIAQEPVYDCSTELHIFEVDGPDLGNPRPHAANPVVFDSRRARNGGRIIESDGDLLRITQENSHGRYGYGLNIMKIKRLSLTEYEEEHVRRITPEFEAGIDGCHHLDIRGGRIVMDVRKKFGGFPHRSH